MKEISKEVENAIKEAIRLEINGRKFFMHAADITEHEKGKKMFRFLADEEVKHMEVFGKLFSQILNSEDWKNYVKDEELRGESSLVERLKERMKNEEGKGEVEALRIGMELEQNAIDFFGKAVFGADDSTAKKIFREIGEEEKFHFDLLQAQYDSVTHSGFWLGSAEFKMDGQW
jgi:rubrerythrin